MAEKDSFEFIGRTEESEELFSCLCQRKGRVFVVTGPPGSGKSWLVSRVLDEYKQKADSSLSVFNIACSNLRSDYDFVKQVSQKIGCGDKVLTGCAGNMGDTDDFVLLLVEQMTHFLKNNVEMQVLFFFDDIDKNRKDVILRFVTQLLTQRDLPKNVTFILTSVLKLSSTKVKVKLISLRKFSNEEVKQLFLKNFDFEASEPFVELVNRYCLGNPMLLSLLGLDMSSDNFLSQRDVQFIIEEEKSRDMLNRENLDESEQWDTKLKYFFKNNISRDTRQRFLEVMNFINDFKPEELSSDPKTVALAKSYLVPLLRSSALDLDEKSGKIAVPPTTREYMKEQESTSCDEESHIFPYGDLREKEIEKMTLKDEDEKSKMTDPDQKSDEARFSPGESEEDSPGPPETRVGEEAEHVNESSVNPNHRTIVNNLNIDMNKENQTKEICPSSIIEDQKNRLAFFQNDGSSSSNIPVDKSDHPLNKTKVVSLEENDLQEEDEFEDQSNCLLSSSFNDPHRIQAETQQHLGTGRRNTYSGEEDSKRSNFRERSRTGDGSYGHHSVDLAVEPRGHLKSETEPKTVGYQGVGSAGSRNNMNTRQICDFKPVNIIETSCSDTNTEASGQMTSAGPQAMTLRSPEDDSALMKGHVALQTTKSNLSSEPNFMAQNRNSVDPQPKIGSDQKFHSRAKGITESPVEVQKGFPELLSNQRLLSNSSTSFSQQVADQRLDPNRQEFVPKLVAAVPPNHSRQHLIHRREQQQPTIPQRWNSPPASTIDMQYNPHISQIGYAGSIRLHDASQLQQQYQLCKSPEPSDQFTGNTQAHNLPHFSMLSTSSSIPHQYADIGATNPYMQESSIPNMLQYGAPPSLDQSQGRSNYQSGQQNLLGGMTSQRYDSLALMNQQHNRGQLSQGYHPSNHGSQQNIQGPPFQAFSQTPLVVNHQPNLGMFPPNVYGGNAQPNPGGILSQSTYLSFPATHQQNNFAMFQHLDGSQHQLHGQQSSGVSSPRQQGSHMQSGVTQNMGFTLSPQHQYRQPNPSAQFGYQRFHVYEHQGNSSHEERYQGSPRAPFRPGLGDRARFPGHQQYRPNQNQFK